LRKDGYRIIATSPHGNTPTIHELDISKPFALIFGTERRGISEEVQQAADEFVRIPMYGFSESFNISVSASIFLYELMKRANEMEIPNFHLSDSERNELRLRWYKDIVPHADIHERHFRQQSQDL